MTDEEVFELLESITAPIVFWRCPVVEHRNRNDANGWPLVEVEWRGDVAYCLEPGCGRSSTDPREMP